MRWDQSQPSSSPLQRGHTHRYETPLWLGLGAGVASFLGSWEGRPRLHAEQGTDGGWASGTQRPRPSAIRRRRRVPPVGAFSQSGHPAGWLFRFRPVVAEAGRRPLSAVTFSSSPSAGRSVRSGSPGPMATARVQYTRVLHPKFSSCRVKRRGTIHPLSLRIPKGLLQPAPPPDGGHRACCCIVPLPERPTGLVRQPIRNERRPVERRASSC